MDEIIKMVVAKTGISEANARSAVDVVISQLKNRLPAGMGSQLDGVLGDKSSGDSSSPMDGLSDKLGGMFGKK